MARKLGISLNLVIHSFILCILLDHRSPISFFYGKNNMKLDDYRDEKFRKDAIVLSVFLK